MKRIIIFMLIPFLLGLTGCKNDDNDDSTTIALAALAVANSNPLVGKWTFTGGSIRSDAGTITISIKSGVSTRTFTADKITDTQNATFLFNSTSLNLNCASVSKYTFDDTTLTETVESGNCNTIGSVTVGTYSINGTKLTVSYSGYSSSLGNYIETDFFVKN